MANAAAKGGIGYLYESGEDGTVAFHGPSLDTPLTFFNLIEKSSTISTLSETIIGQKAALNNVTVTGDYIYASDTGNNRIVVLKLNPDGGLSFKFAFGINVKKS